MIIPRIKKPRGKISIPGHNGMLVLAPATIDDPFEPGKKIHGTRNLAASPLTAIYARGRLRGQNETQEDAEARYVAGQRFRGLYERAEMGGSRAIDYSAVKVDISFVHRDIPESSAKAMRELADIARRLGSDYGIVHAIVGEEKRFMEVADAMAGRQSSGRERLDTYAALRSALDALIMFWGVAVGRRPRQQPPIFNGTEESYNGFIIQTVKSIDYGVGEP